MTSPLRFRSSESSAEARKDADAARTRAVNDLAETSLPLPWGRKDLDSLTGGVKLGRFVVVGARPGNGKTTFLLNWLDQLYDHENAYTVVYVGTELSPSALYAKWAAFRLRYDEDTVMCNRWDKLPDGAQDKVIEEVERLTSVESSDRIWLPECRNPTLTNLESLVTQARRFGCGAHVMIFDHLHRMNPDGFRSEREALQAAAIKLQTMAEELDMAIVVASQLRRAEFDQMFDLYRPPALGSYKGASGIEENADIALGLYRPLKRMSPRQERDVRKGEQPITTFAIPNCMVVKCLKHRYRGAALDRMVYLSCENGVLGDWTWREDEL
jgi:replicative DNA helicase